MKEMEMTKKKESSNYHMGKHSGYELIDGVYHIAPIYTDHFARLADRQNGVDRFVKSIVRHAAEINNEIAVEQRSLWERIYEDLGLDREINYTYHNNGTITVMKDKAKQP